MHEVVIIGDPGPFRQEAVNRIREEHPEALIVEFDTHEEFIMKHYKDKFIPMSRIAEQLAIAPVFRHKDKPNHIAGFHTPFHKRK